jgi:hypothetical protein
MFEYPKTELGLDWRRIVGIVLVLSSGIAIWIAIPIAINNRSFAYLVGAGLVSIVIWDALWQRKRTAALRAMAIRRGFVYLGRAIPRSLTLRRTPFERATRIWNVIDGDCHGTRVIAFDCDIGSGKGSWRRTAIAAQSANDVFGAVKFSRDLTVDRSGDWIVLYQPRPGSLFATGLMPVAELEAHLDAIAVPAP